jgi:hypothetical protein
MKNIISMLLLLAFFGISFAAADLFVPGTVQTHASYSFEKAIGATPFVDEGAFSGMYWGTQDLGEDGQTTSLAGVVANKLTTDSDSIGLTEQYIKQTGTTDTFSRPYFSQEGKPAFTASFDKSQYAWASGDMSTFTVYPTSYAAVGGTVPVANAEPITSYLVERPYDQQHVTVFLPDWTPELGEFGGKLKEVYGSFESSGSLAVDPWTGLNTAGGSASITGGFDNAIQPAGHQNEIEINGVLSDHIWNTEYVGYVPMDIPNQEEFPWDPDTQGPVTWPSLDNPDGSWWST